MIYKSIKLDKFKSVLDWDEESYMASKNIVHIVPNQAKN